MRTDHRIGGGASAPHYRHPLVFRISQFLDVLWDVPDPSTRRRVWWTPFKAGLAAVLMVLDRGCSLQERFADARRCLALEFTSCAGKGGSYNGWIKALERQADMILPTVKAGLRQHVQKRLSRLRKRKKWLLLAVDGSKYELPRTKDMEKVFGIADNGKIPQALSTTIVEVETGLPWDWRIDHSRGSEQGHLLAMAADLPAHALLLGDGNFVGFPIWSQLNSNGKKFLIRVGGDVHLITRLWPEAEARYEGKIVYVWPKQRRREAPLMLRLIRVGRGRKAVYLLTNVLDTEELSEREAGRVYRQRWGVELFFRSLKRTLGYHKLKSRSGRRARLELEWAMIAVTIITLMGIDAAFRYRVQPARLSSAGMLRELRSYLLHDPKTYLPYDPARLDKRLVGELKDDYHRTRPKRSRYRPVTKNTPKPLILLPPKIRSATPKERKAAKKYLERNAA